MGWGLRVDRLPFRRAMGKSTEGGRAGAGEAEGIGNESTGTSAKEGEGDWNETRSLKGFLELIHG